MKTIPIKYNAQKIKVFFLLILSSFIFNCADLDQLAKDSKSLFEDELAKREVNFKPYDDTNQNPPLVQYIADYQYSLSVLYANHLKRTCIYSKIPFEIDNLKNWNANHIIHPTTRVIVVLETKKLDDASVEILTNFVAKGGTLYVPFFCDDRRFGFLMGMKISADYDTDTVSAGFHFSTPFLPTMTGKSVREEAVHFGMMRKNFSENITILATAANNEDYPTIFINKVGKGKVVNFNTSFELEKRDRGLLFSGLLLGLEHIPYPIANASTIFLDDFPAPLYDAIQEPIKSEMNLSIEKFVKNIWWPDMKKLATKYDISYCAIPAFDYNAKTNPPFLFTQWDAKKEKIDNKVEPISSWLMRDCIKNGHELGFHGYNHVSLTRKDWKNPQFISMALEGVQKKWQVSNFQLFPISYVPPSNIIDDMGLKQLKEGMPSLGFMCSLYLGDLKEGGDREFDYDPFHPGLYDYPRISSGFFIRDSEQYNIQSLFLYTGIWTHFVHPDDVYQIPSPFNKSAGKFDLRNPDGLGWRKSKKSSKSLLGEFEKFMKDFTDAFPQTRFLNAYEGGKATLEWRASKFKHTRENNYFQNSKIISNSTSDNQFWLLYSSKENVTQLENQLQNISGIYNKTPYSDGYLYSIFTDDYFIKLIDLHSPTKNNSTIITNVVEDLKKYQLAVKLFEKNGNWVDNSEQLFREELAKLKQSMLTEEEINYTTWNSYANYLSWENKGLQVWEMLEKHVLQYPSKNNVMYAAELAKIIDYPNEIAREKWLNAMILVNPNDKILLNTYVADYNSAENKEKIRAALKKLLELDSSESSIYNYLQHLLEYDPKAALIELEKYSPNASLKGLATAITWLYADNKNIQKAYDWSLFSDEISTPTRLEWLLELKQFTTLEEEYQKYIAKNQDDFKTKAMMSYYYHSKGDFKQAWILADELPDSKEKQDLRIMLNKDVVYEPTPLQQYLLENHPKLFFTQISNDLTKKNRLKLGNFVESENVLQTNQDLKQSLTTRHSFNFNDKKYNQHRIAVTYSEFYPIPRFDTISGDPLRMANRNSANELENSQVNIFRSLYGIEYRFKNPFSYEKLQYWGRARVEKDNFDNLYFQAGIGINKGKGKKYQSAEINLFPVETAPAHTKEIYQVRTNLYDSRFLFNRINTSLAIEGSYYSESNSSFNTFYEAAFDVTATFRVGWDKGDIKKSKWVPYLETAYTYGSQSFPDGYPYWILDSRLYGGGGINWAYGLEDDDFITTLDGGIFKDDFADYFQRYSGSISYRIFNYMALVGRFEIFVQDRFYSNTIQFGLKYHFKEKKVTGNKN